MLGQESRTPTEFASYETTEAKAKELIEEGTDVNFIDAWTNGRVQITEAPVPQITEETLTEQVIYEDEVKPFEDNPDDTQVEEVQEIKEEDSSEQGVGGSPIEGDEDYLTETEAKRKLFDEQNTKIEELTAENKRLADEKEQREKDLLEELDSVRAEKESVSENTLDMTDEELDAYLEGIEAKTEKAVETATTQNNSTDNSELINEHKELRAQVSALIAEREAEKLADRENRLEKEYDTFLKSEHGKKFDFKRPITEALRDIDNLHDKLSDAIGDSTKATRFLLDLKNPKLKDIREKELKEFGLSKSEDFDDAFKAFEINLYKEGKKLDQDTGKLITVRKNPFESMEEAYWNLDGKKLVAEAHRTAHNEIKGKLDQRNNAAVATDPSRYKAPPVTSRTRDPRYIASINKQVKKYVRNGTLKPEFIREPNLRQAYLEIQADRFQ